MGNRRLADHPAWYAELVESLRNAHDQTTNGGTDTPFTFVERAGRRFAVCEYGARTYDGGVKVWLAVDLAVGASISWTVYDSAWAQEAMTFACFFHPDLVRANDPVRQWLAADRADRTTRRLRLEEPDAVERFAAAQLVGSENPGLFAPADAALDVHPSAVLFRGGVLPGRFAPGVSPRFP